MADFKVRFLSSAAREVESAERWYREAAPQEALNFLGDIHSAVERIAESPHRWKAITPAHRCIHLHRFPFVIIYRVRGLVVEIIAVAHHRRDPDYWQRRH